jgi:hypothetical protein
MGRGALILECAVRPSTVKYCRGKQGVALCDLSAPTMPPNAIFPSDSTRVPSQTQIAEIIAASADVSLRNLRITACYGELSHVIAATVGAENVNWCTFATWASKTAGRFIRLAGMDERIRGAVQEALGSTGLIDTLRSSLRHLPSGIEFVHERIIEAAKDLAVEVSTEVAAGNLTVFAELAPLFSAMVGAMGELKIGSRDAASRVIKSLQPGTTTQGGQDLLRRAVLDYFEAMPLTDGRQKAELILRANAQVGAHEQIRLQPYIHKAMTTSLADRVTARIHRELRETTTEPVGRRLSVILDARLRPYGTALQQAWLQIATGYLMTLELPNGTLHLGRDVPSAPGQPLFPPELTDLQDAELLRILRIYDADGVNAHGSGASDWSNLSERMRYILELFRSRQRDQSLFAQP